MVQIGPTVVVDCAQPTEVYGTANQEVRTRIACNRPIVCHSGPSWIRKISIALMHVHHTHCQGVLSMSPQELLVTLDERRRFVHPPTGTEAESAIHRHVWRLGEGSGLIGIHAKVFRRLSRGIYLWKSFRSRVGDLELVNKVRSKRVCFGSGIALEGCATRSMERWKLVRESI